MFNLGIDNEIIKKNPLAKISKLREDNHKIRFLTIEEEEKLFAEIERKHEVLDRYTRKKKLIQPYLFLKPIVITALQTGMRRGEILNLRWTNIDFDFGFIELLDTKSVKQERYLYHQPLERYLKTLKRNQNMFSLTRKRMNLI